MRHVERRRLEVSVWLSGKNVRPAGVNNRVVVRGQDGQGNVKASCWVFVRSLCGMVEDRDAVLRTDKGRRGVLSSSRRRHRRGLIKRRRSVRERAAHLPVLMMNDSIFKRRRCTPPVVFVVGVLLGTVVETQRVALFELDPREGRV